MKRTLLFALAAVVATAIALPASAFAGTLTLHPAGFGAFSYSAWKAHQGLPDSQGNDSQALYFQKMTTTATFAAGVAVVKGVAGLPASALTGLAWDHRVDGHCGAGAPRWDIFLSNNTTVFLGCYADATHSPVGANWCHDEFSPQSAIPNVAGLTITGLAIVFDEGTDNPIPQPLGCPIGPSTPGFVYLDNIEVDINGVPHCWTSADDNSNQSTGPCPDPPDASAGSAPTSLDVPTGLAIDPLDTEFVTTLGLAFPGVPLPAWLQFPNVLY